jgi:GTP pyrophosphokinase
MHGSVKPDALYVSIAEGKIVLGKVDLEELKEKGEEGRWKKLFSFGKKAPKQEAKKATVDKNFDKKKAIKLTEESIQNQYTLCDCCKPIPGDKVMGYIDDDKHIVVHKLQCPNAEKLKANRGNRVLAAEWEMGHVILFPVSIYVKGFDKLGLLHKMTQVISQLHGVNIRKLEVESDNGIFECTVQIFVHDTKDADAIITSLREIQDIKEVARI